MSKLGILAAAILGIISVNGYAEPSQKVTAFPYSYSVKFLCGLQNVPSGGPNTPYPLEPPVKPGNYATSINIHNYHGSQASTFRKAIVVNGQIGAISSSIIFPNQAIAITCKEIVGMLKPPFPPFIEGFVEFGSTLQMSVAAVYTSQSCLSPAGGTNCSQLGELDLEVVPQTAFRDQ